MTKKAKKVIVAPVPVVQLKCRVCGAGYNSDDPDILSEQDCIKCGQCDCID